MSGDPYSFPHFQQKFQFLIRLFFLFRVDYLDEVLLKPQFKKSLDLQISSSMGYFKKTNAFLVYTKFLHETVLGKWCLRKSVRQTGNGL